MAGKKREGKKWVLVFSDTHVGSWCGLWPEGFVSQSGHELPQSKFQKWLWHCWKDAWSWVEHTVGNDDLTVVFNGDSVEGIHHKTIEVMSANPDDQYIACEQVFRPVANRASKLFVTKGTECHTKNHEVSLGHQLGAVPNPQTGQAAWDYLQIEVNGCVCSFAHHTSATSRPYLEASQHSIALGVDSMESARNGRDVPSVICRGHRHRHGIWMDGNNISIVTGAFQGLTRHGHKVVPAAIPNPSVVLLEFSGPDYKGSSFVQESLPKVHPRVYRPAQDKPVKV